MAISQAKAATKASGGMYKKNYRKKKQHELGRQAALTHIGKRRARSTRTLGANTKTRVLSSDGINLLDPKTKKYEKAVIKNVVENAANRHFIRRNIMTKGAVVETDKGKAKITSRPGQDGTVNGVLVS